MISTKTNNWPECIRSYGPKVHGLRHLLRLVQFQAGPLWELGVKFMELTELAGFSAVRAVLINIFSIWGTRHDVTMWRGFSIGVHGGTSVMLLFCFLQLDMLANFLVKSENSSTSVEHPDRTRQLCRSQFQPRCICTFLVVQGSFWPKSPIHLWSREKCRTQNESQRFIDFYQTWTFATLFFSRTNWRNRVRYIRIRTNCLSAVGSLGAFLGHICLTNLGHLMAFRLVHLLFVHSFCIFWWRQKWAWQFRRAQCSVPKPVALALSATPKAGTNVEVKWSLLIII